MFRRTTGAIASIMLVFVRAACASGGGGYNEGGSKILEKANPSGCPCR